MSTAPKIEKNNIVDICGLSPQQESFLFQYLKTGGGASYTVRLLLDIRGLLEPEKCNNAWKSVVLDHEILRTVFRWEDIKSPVQIVLKNSAFEVSLADYSFQNMAQMPLDEIAKSLPETTIDLEQQSLPV